MGDDIDYIALLQLLNTANKCNTKCMIELEQYIGEWTFHHKELKGVDYKSKAVDMTKFNDFKAMLNINIPQFELHFGFDIIKSKNNIMPIKLDVLTDKCTKAGFNNGGWFIFKDDKVWKYRSNEFCDLPFDHAKTKLFEQTATLHGILLEYDINIAIGLSLEIVHGIWQF
jgi:hypothetical protein